MEYETEQHPVEKRHEIKLLGARLKFLLLIFIFWSLFVSVSLYWNIRGLESVLPSPLEARRAQKKRLVLFHTGFFLIGAVGIFGMYHLSKRAERALGEREETLRRLSMTDGLTGIANRRHFDETYGREWMRAVRHSSPLSVILLDIDFFKQYNDTYGHQAGDDCLRAVAGCIRRALKRPADLAARFGGEEFIALLPGTDGGGAEGIAEEMLGRVRDLKIVHSISTISPFVTISAGVSSMTPSRKLMPSYLLALADSALYRAKREGRNRVAAA